MRWGEPVEAASNLSVLVSLSRAGWVCPAVGRGQGSSEGGLLCTQHSWASWVKALHPSPTTYLLCDRGKSPHLSES